MIGLLRTWATDPDSVIRIAARPDWLLDGWEQICLIWNYARDDATRSAALVEILEHVPILPRRSTTGADGARRTRSTLFGNARSP